MVSTSFVPPETTYHRGVLGWRERAWQKCQGESKNFAWLPPSVRLGRRMWRLGWKPCASFPYFPEDLEGTREQKYAGLVTSAH